jgi:hypothetical protein
MRFVRSDRIPQQRLTSKDQCGNLLGESESTIILWHSLISITDPLELGSPRCKLDGQTPVPRETKVRVNYSPVLSRTVA